MRSPLAELCIEHTNTLAGDHSQADNQHILSGKIRQWSIVFSGFLRYAYPCMVTSVRTMFVTFLSAELCRVNVVLTASSTLTSFI